MFIHDLIYAFVALFPVMNPIGNGFIVNGFLGGLNGLERKAATKKIIINCLLISIGSLVAGHLVLLLFGLAVPVIQIGGGIIICKTGWDWLSDSSKSSTSSASQDVKNINMNDIENKLFYPLSFPMVIGPGTISVIFALMATATIKNDLLKTSINYIAIILAIAALLTVLYIVLKASPRITKKLGTSGSLIINKLIAFITFCIGIQIFITGISKVFHLTIL